MENPYGWPQELVDSWLERLRGVSVNRYPDSAAGAVTERLRAAMDVPAGQAVVLGNGSDELIQMIMLSVGAPGRVVLAPEPTFVMYRILATVCGLNYAAVDLNRDFTLDRQATLDAIRVREPAVVFLAYPNNPTGNLFDAETVLRILEASPGLVVVDEAYSAFSGATFMDRLGAYENLLVMRTVSKTGLAGLRLGLLAGPRPWIDQIGKVRLPYNISTLTQVSAEFALAHKEVFDAQAEQIRAERGALMEAMRKRSGVTVYSSQANFILFRVARGRGPAVFDGLKERGVLVKDLSGAGGHLQDCLRVTVGTHEENQAFLQALDGALREPG